VMSHDFLSLIDRLLSQGLDARFVQMGLSETAELFVEVRLS